MRKFARLDDNHTAIVTKLRQACCAVQSLASVGNGCPDLLVSRNGQMWLMEVKDGDKSPSRQRLTEDEALWISKWKAPVHIVRTVDEALALIETACDRDRGD